ncbi:MAG: hypothetical protein WD490_02915 [Opitutales bacterium]
MTSAENTTIQQLRKTFQTFWDSNLRIERNAAGIVIAPPVMDATGWQVVLHLEPMTPGKWMVSDHGKTLANGLPEGAKGFKERLHQLENSFGFRREGLELVKIVSEPFDAVELQIFAEGMAAVSHLVLHLLEQAKPASFTGVVESRVSSFFYSRHIAAARDTKLKGKVEAEIVVDFFVPAKRPLAVEMVKRNRNLRPYMEQWGWRWTDLKEANPDLVRIMVYDPDNQKWDETSIKIGRKVCELFIPYTETERLAEHIPA